MAADFFPQGRFYKIPVLLNQNFFFSYLIGCSYSSALHILKNFSSVSLSVFVGASLPNWPSVWRWILPNLNLMDIHGKVVKLADTTHIYMYTKYNGVMLSTTQRSHEQGG